MQIEGRLWSNGIEAQKRQNPKSTNMVNPIVSVLLYCRFLFFYFRGLEFDRRGITVAVLLWFIPFLAFEEFRKLKNDDFEDGK